MAGLKIILRGSIWWVDLRPTLGQEIEKTRPCVVISSDALHKLAVRLVVPITGKEHGRPDPRFHVPVAVTDTKAWESKGLPKDSFADVLQTRCVSTQRFPDDGYITAMNADKLAEIINLLAAVVELEP